MIFIFARTVAQARSQAMRMDLMTSQYSSLTPDTPIERIIGLDDFDILAMDPLPQRLLEIVHSRRNVRIWRLHE